MTTAHEHQTPTARAPAHGRGEGSMRPGRQAAPRTAAALVRWGFTVLVALASTAVLLPAFADNGNKLASAPVREVSGGVASAYDGVVQAVRQTVLSAQVSGAIVELPVKAGDAVRAGQVLVRLDARAAEQTAAAGQAQVQAARATLQAARSEFERQQQLFAQNYISRAALERAQEQYQTAQAQVAAQLAGAGATRTQSGFYVVKAPYAGVVADVPVVLGDMALPGKTLLTLYDPAALRVSAFVPQGEATPLDERAAVRVELPGMPQAQRWQTPTRLQVLPTVDPATHTVELRLDLPAGLQGVTPGMFARAWLPGQADAQARLQVPAQAVLRRAELDGVYVIGADGRPLLRQVRLGRRDGDAVEVLSGLSAGERVALDPQAAARIR